MSRREAEGGESGPSSSLDSLTQTAEPRRRFIECPRSRGGRLLRAPWGEIIPAPCRAVRCPVCGPGIKVWEAISTIVWRLSQFEHARYAVLTIPHPDWSMDKLRREVAEFVRRIRRWGYEMEAAYVVAEFAGDTGYHVDFYSHGDYIDQRVWQKANRKEIVNVQRISGGGNRSISYAFKETLGYAFKETSERFERHLELNGGKLYRTTRHFYGELTRREAESAARLERRASQGHSGWEAIYGNSDLLLPRGEGARLLGLAAAAANRQEPA